MIAYLHLLAHLLVQLLHGHGIDHKRLGGVGIRKNTDDGLPLRER